MRTYGVLLSVIMLLCPVVATAGTLAPAAATTGVLDADSNVGTTLATTLAGEDVSNDVQKTEERYLTIPTGGTDAMVSADQLYKSGLAMCDRLPFTAMRPPRLGRLRYG